jgi:hypothetical protein
LSLFLGLKGKNLKLPTYNIWYYPVDNDFDLEKARDKYIETRDPKWRAFFISCGTAKSN